MNQLMQITETNHPPDLVQPSDHPLQLMARSEPIPFVAPRQWTSRAYVDGDLMVLEVVELEPSPAPAEVVFDVVDTPASDALAALLNAPEEEALDASPASASASEDGCSDLPEIAPTAPEIAPFLLWAKEQRKDDDEVSLKEVGRDFNDLPAEVALLSQCIAEPKTLNKIAADLNTEVFYEKYNRAIFLAMFELCNSGTAVTVASILGHLKDTEPDYGSDYVGYLDMLVRVRSREDHVVAYVSRLNRAARVRGGEGYCVYPFSEPFSAYLLLQRVPDMKFLGDDLHVYGQGSWLKKDRDDYSFEAMKSIHPRHRTAKHGQSVLDYTKMIRQVAKDTFHGAYKKVGDVILINANNGVVEVSVDGTIRFREHSKGDFFTLKLAPDYDPSAKCEVFESALMDALPDEADRDVLQVFGGYILFPGCEHEASLVCYGPGGTGKSTILNGVANVFGKPLCGSASLEELCKSSGYSLPTVRDKMLNLGSELNGTEIEESANFKKLVSGEGMLARQIYCKPDEMTTTCKLVFLSNNMPRFKSGTDAEARRLRILHFSRKPAVKDARLKAKIGAEISGILNWMLAGLVRLLREGAIPEGGAAAKRVLEVFSRGNDPIGSFVHECCTIHPKLEVAKKDLFDAFNVWSQTNGLPYGDRMENFFWKGLRARYDLRDTKRSLEGGGRENALLGIVNGKFPDGFLEGMR